MLNRALGIDFGTSNTVLAMLENANAASQVIHIPEYGFFPDPQNPALSIIPSLIHYAEDGRVYIGNQVSERNLENSPATLRWMKQYISRRSPARIHIAGREVTPALAASDFLKVLLLSAAGEVELSQIQPGLAVPVEAFEHYSDWLSSVIRSTGISSLRLIDEPAAAALGYDQAIRPGSLLMLIDLGGGTMDVSIVIIEPGAEPSGNFCRVLGKSGRNLGGTSIDSWLYENFLQYYGWVDYDTALRGQSLSLLLGLRQLKERLSFKDSASFSWAFPGKNGEFQLTEADFQNLLETKGLYTSLHQMIREALTAIHDKGYAEADIDAVLMIGGGSYIPSIRRLVRQIFGGEKVLFAHPMDSVARGAARFALGASLEDFIQHDYAVRFFDPRRNRYDYRTIIAKGTPYPLQEPISLVVKAANDNQKYLGLAIFEISKASQNASAKIEIVFDSQGNAVFQPLSQDNLAARAEFWMNEGNPTFLTADPPARKGEDRIEVSFRVNRNKQLVIDARDLLNGSTLLRDHLVVTLR